MRVCNKSKIKAAKNGKKEKKSILCKYSHVTFGFECWMLTHADIYIQLKINKSDFCVGKNKTK